MGNASQLAFVQMQNQIQCYGTVDPQSVLFQREIKVCKTSLIHANSAITLKCKSKYLFNKAEKPILFLQVIDGNLYGSLQIHESFERIKNDRTSYKTLKIYNPSSEPYYFRKGTLTYNVCIVIPLESKRKTLHITEPAMKMKKNDSPEN